LIFTLKRVENDAPEWLIKRLSMPNLLYWLASTIGTLKVPGLLPSDYQLGNLQQMFLKFFYCLYSNAVLGTILNMFLA
jgi:hypothetical protein